MASPSVLTFDVYGTLARWDETLREAFGDVLTARGRADADLELACNAFEAESRRLQSVGAFRSYREILADSIVPAMATAGLRPQPSDREAILDRLAQVPPFAEVPSILAALAEKHRLAPISNTDDDFLKGTLAGLGPVFSTTVTAQQARAYKPNPGLFRFAHRKLGVEPADVLHVAQGTFSDLAVCAALGLQVVWVNRQRQALQDSLAPIAVIDDLSSLPAVVASLSDAIVSGVQGTCS